MGNGLAELRSLYGTGHGKPGSADEIHAEADRTGGFATKSALIKVSVRL
jgi:hypothetical protein